MNKVLRIENIIKQSFNLMIDFTLGISDWGKWQTLNQGVISYNMGFTKEYRIKGTFSSYDLYLHAIDDKKNDKGWIIRLNNFGDFWGSNDAGEGHLVESCAIDIQGDYIRWEVVKIPNIS